jgi:hypothetical protein
VQAFERSDFAYIPLADIPANLIEIAERVAGRPVGAEVVAAVERARLFTGWSGTELTEMQAQARHLHADGAPAVPAPSRMLGADRAIPERRPAPGRLAMVEQVNPLDLGQDD